MPTTCDAGSPRPGVIGIAGFRYPKCSRYDIIVVVSDDDRPAQSPYLSVLASALRHKNLLTASLLLSLVAVHLFGILRFGCARIDGAVYFLLDDDVMISMQYGKNLAAGEGLVHNVGERVEGFTNPLLTFFAATIHLLPVQRSLLPLFIDLLNLALSACILLMLITFWGKEPEDLLSGFVAAAFYITLPHHTFFSHTGFEVYLLIAIFLYSIVRIESRSRLDAIILGLLPLTHATALVLWVVLLLAKIVVVKLDVAKRLLLLAFSALPLVAYEIFRLIYYRDFVPNTFWLKVGAGSIWLGQLYLRQWVVLVLPLALLGSYVLFVTRSRKADLLAIVAISHCLVVISIGGDIFPQYRFLFPISVLLVLLAGRGTVGLWKRISCLSNQAGRHWLLAGVALCVAFAAIYRPVQDYRTNKHSYDYNKRWSVGHLTLGKAIRENTKRGSTVAVFSLGYIGYYADRRMIDMLGIIDRHIARMKPIPGRMIGHNKEDFDYVLGLRPDLIQLNISPDKLPNREWLKVISAGPVGYHADLAQNEVFEKQYSPNPILDTRRRFVQFYASAPSAEWQVSEECFSNLRAIR
jgi:arabinofuranosyltransferase